MRQALLVIDVQESFRQRSYFRPEELPAFLANVQSLIDRAPERGIPVVQVFHREPGDDCTDPFTAASGFVRPMPELALHADAVFHKQVHSAMFGTDVDFRVRYVTDATLTFPMRTRSGREVSAAEIRERTELVLDQRFARIVSTAEALG